MTDELKTLKDIAFPRQGGSCYRTEELKAEAVKWAKELKKDRGELDFLTRDMVFEMFFNLTDEDLK